MSNSKPELVEEKSHREPSFDEKDLKGRFDPEKNRFTDFKPRRFIPGVQPEIDLFSTITIYGKRRTGKTVFVKWMLQYYKNYFPWVWIFTKTRQNNHYASFCPEKFIIQSFDADKLTSIMNRQKVWVKEYLDKGELCPRACIIWDDYSGQDIRFNNVLSEYYWTGRHYATMNFFCAQVCFLFLFLFFPNGWSG